MIRLVPHFRLVPLVLVATIALFALKTFGLVLDGGYTLGERASGGDDGDITGSIGGRRAPRCCRPMTRGLPRPRRRGCRVAPILGAGDVRLPRHHGLDLGEQAGRTSGGQGSKTAPAEPQPTPGTPVPLDRTPSAAERAILERLSERRTELDARARELDMRESLIKAAEKRLEARITELKEIEARINNATQQKEEGEAAKFKNLITMYENMKAKDAAKIFDRLELRVLVEVATQINPRRMSDILAQMSAEAAERLTVELAARAKDKDRPAICPRSRASRRPTEFAGVWFKLLKTLSFLGLNLNAALNGDG